MVGSAITGSAKLLPARLLLPYAPLMLGSLSAPELVQQTKKEAH